MSKSLYRKDISHQEYKILVNFSYGLNKMINDSYMRWGKVLFLGEVNLSLPLWYRSLTEWKLSCFRTFQREAVGIDRHAMNKLAKYLGMRTQDLVALLYKLSMLAVDPLNNNVLNSYTGMLSGTDSVESGYGYIVEKRRALNGFAHSEDRNQERLAIGNRLEVKNAN